MFAFDDWAEWLKSKGHDLSSNGLVAEFKDARSFGGSNPSFGLDVEMPGLLGNISFWRNGLCDFLVIDTDERELAREYMRDANDETVPLLFEEFVSFFGRS